jgi:hypothetical protein
LRIYDDRNDKFEDGAACYNAIPLNAIADIKYKFISNNLIKIEGGNEDLMEK